MELCLVAALAGAVDLRDPPGPATRWDPREPGVPKRVVRGGSYLCSATYCTGYRPWARNQAAPAASFSHTGFRCVADSAARAPR